MINDRIDLAHWRERLQREGRVQVADYLQPTAAERLRQCLEQEVPWTLALRDATGARTIDHAAYAAMDEDTRSALLAQADWGGLLQFIDVDGQVLDTFLPRWNTLSLFAVPAGHAVSLVAPWARQDRLAITGWLLT